MNPSTTLKQAATAASLFFACLNTASADPFGETAVITQGYSQIAHYNPKARLHRPGKRSSENKPSHHRVATKPAQRCERPPRLPKNVSVYKSRPCPTTSGDTAHTTQ
jgi:hypothetical protein